MKNIIIPVLLFLFCFSGTGRAQNTGTVFHGLKITSDNQGHYFVSNEHGTEILPMDSIRFNVDSVITAINRSSISDRMLIVRVLQMRSNPADKRTELLNMTQTYPEIAVMVLQRTEAELKKKYTAEELERLKSIKR